MSKYMVTDVACGACGTPLWHAQSGWNEPNPLKNFVYRNGLKILCPNCGLAHEWPYRLHVEEQCVRCGKSPDFVFGNDVNRPILYCKKCMESKVVAELSEIAEREPTPFNWLRWLGAVFLALGLFCLYGTIMLLSERDFNVGLAAMAALCIVGGVLMIFYNKASVQADLERQRKRHAAAREILDRISKGGMSVEQRLAVFGLVPGNPFRTDYLAYALRQGQLQAKEVESRSETAQADLNELCDELLVLLTDYLKREPKTLKRIREIGEQLNQEGGFELMQRVGRLVQARDPLKASWLNNAWDDIGDWRS